MSSYAPNRRRFLQSSAAAAAAGLTAPYWFTSRALAAEGKKFGDLKG